MLSSINAWTQNQDTTSTFLLNEEGSAYIIFDEEFLDIGALTLGDSLWVIFTFNNKSDIELSVSDVEIDCACMRADFNSEEIIKPGEKGQIRLMFTPRIHGRFSRNIVVHFKEIEWQYILNFYGQVLRP